MQGQAQLTLFDVIEAQDTATWVASNTKAYAELVQGDYVEIRWEDGSVVSGWCAARHPVDGVWQVQQDTQGWAPGQKGPRYIYLGRWIETWRFVRRDDTWQLAPTPDELSAWMRKQAQDLPLSRFHELYHAATDAWPMGVDAAWREAMSETFTELAIQRFPLDQYLREHRKARGSGKRIWACPERVCREITETIWPMPPEARLDAVMALRWTRAEDFEDEYVKAHGALRGFNRSTASIYEGYLRWAIAHAKDARQLLEVLDDWGSNPVREAESNEQAEVAQ